MSDKIYRAWHVCPDDMMTQAYHGVPRMPIVEGETIEMVGCAEPMCGVVGMHASERLLNALSYRARSCRICLVDVWGDVHVEEDRIAGRYRRVVRVIPQPIVDMECRFFAASVAHRLLMAERAAGREPAKASWDAIEVARRYAVGLASDDDLAAAEWAAEWAARAAAARAAEAAISTAFAAAWGAARAAGRAASSSGSAFSSRTALSFELEDRLLRCVEVPR